MGALAWDMAEINFLPAREVIRRSGLSRATLYRLMGKGAFPKPYPLSAGRVGWNSEEIEAWIMKRLSRSGDDAVTAPREP